MTREQATQAILEKLDEVRQILDRADPRRQRPFFDACIDRFRTKTTISFQVYNSEMPLDTWLEYREDGYK